MSRLNASQVKWVLYPWFEENCAHLIHVDDLKGFRELKPYGRIFRYCGISENYPIIKYGDKQFRVLPDLLKYLRASEKVMIVDGGEAEVSDTMWHHKNECSIYTLLIDGKKKNRRYCSDDLANI